MEEVIKLTKFTISPDSVAPLKAPLTLEMEYTLSAPIADGVWDLAYVADYTQKRYEIPLHQTPVGKLAPGAHAYAHTLAAIPTEGVKEKYLLQVGLLRLSLRDAASAENVASINMVVQVSKDATGALVRNIMSPLDE